MIHSSHCCHGTHHIVKRFLSNYLVSSCILDCKDNETLSLRQDKKTGKKWSISSLIIVGGCFGNERSEFPKPEDTICFGNFEDSFPKQLKIPETTNDSYELETYFLDFSPLWAKIEAFPFASVG
jgi:hypothetical protein